MTDSRLWLTVIFDFWRRMPIPQTGREIRLTTLSTCAG
jgi:hypothetical protein